MINNFDKLGKYIEKQTKNLKDIDNEFPPVAFEALAKFEPEEKINCKFLANWAANSKNMPPQTQVSNGFGDPPLLVFGSEKFYIEALIWFPSRTGIHDHGFCGAFRVLQGVSVHTQYNHINAEFHSNNAVKIGELKLKAIDLIVPGVMSQVLPLDGFIHSVVHLGMPSITLIARTYGLASHKGFTQYYYSRTGIAYQSFHKQHLLQRQLQAIFLLRRLQDDDFLKTLADYIKNGDLHRRIVALQYVSQNIKNVDMLEKCTDIVLNGLEDDLKEKMIALPKESNRQHSMWDGIGNFKDKSKYLDIALAEIVGNKQEISDNLTAFHPETPVDDLLKKWRETVVAGMAIQ